MNIASGTSENTEVVIEQGAIPIFVALLSSPSDDVRDQDEMRLVLGPFLSDDTNENQVVIEVGACRRLVELLLLQNYYKIESSTTALDKNLGLPTSISSVGKSIQDIALKYMGSFPTDIIRLDEDIMSPLAGRRSNFMLMRGYISGNTSKLLDRPICK
ncbi:hypothetical protein C5167_022153 [Papaver somniferum]|uniref:Uncharacterized protein n=1 Tax=Papaver somniferum TaxID=3469 RepID=A0A4Y7JK94_PAPSO|nr:hypothetical protein C5167_022153 [Papaver somniferum]